MKTVVFFLVTISMSLYSTGHGVAQEATYMDSGITCQVIYAFGESRDRDKVELLIAALVHPDRDIRRTAARALGKIRDSRSTMPLINVLLTSEECHTVRAVAAWALGQMKSQEAMDSLRLCLDGNNPTVKRQARIAMLKINNQR